MSLCSSQEQTREKTLEINCHVNCQASPQIDAIEVTYGRGEMAGYGELQEFISQKVFQPQRNVSIYIRKGNT